jgi:Ca-activated chloride channel family protein
MRRLPVCLALATTLAAAAPARAQVGFEARTESGNAATDQLPLTSERVRVSIDRQFASTTLQQTFENRSGQRLEGRYVVRAGGGARVQGFAYWNGENKIVGEVFERDTARQVYAETAGLRRDPGLLEEVGEGAFAFRVFPIEPGERKRVEVALGQRLARVGATVEYRLPLGPVPSEVVIELDDERALAHLRSPSHALQVETLGPGRFRVRAQPGAARELVFQYDVSEAPGTLSLTAHRDRGHDAYLVLAMAAPIERQTPAPKDLTLVIDRSGSMSGQPMAEARLAAAAVVERLGARDRVNVVAFDDGVDVLYAEPHPVTAEVRAAALGFIGGIKEGGGTNLALALERALSTRSTAGRPHVVLFLTDGQSPNAPVFEAARKDRGDARVFTVGLGAGVDKALLARLSSLKRGRFTYIESAEAIRPRVERLFKEIEAPVLLGLDLEVEGATLTRRYPKTLPDLAVGEELVVTARAAGAGPVTVKVTGTLGGRPVTYVRKLELAPEVRRPWAGRFWAAARAEDLQEEIALSGESEELKKEVIDLALSYNFVTRYTAFLAVPESELSAANKSVLASARERKQAVLAAHKDAAALSRDAMPPGDPVLTVKAPADARQVTAAFPFGLVKDLAFEPRLGVWRTRFLVPKDVRDGVYQAEVLVVHADGREQRLQVAYTIDAEEPAFEVKTEPTAAGVRVEVITAEAAREVTVALASNPKLRVRLTRDPSGLRFAGELPLPPGAHELRVVVADMAHNEASDLFTVAVSPAGR